MTDTWPIWMTKEQADRLRANIQSAGFTNITLAESDGGAAYLEVTAKADGRTFEHRADDPYELTNVVFDLEGQRKRRKGEGSGLAEDGA